MSEKAAPAGASVLPEVDDVLADAHRVLTGAGFALPQDVAAACVRSAAAPCCACPVLRSRWD
ncbi:hypothetical protein [Streptomyces griseus]|uniref:hypothetical protein n=1 Tax=Streptomyces griseus TaxID=1911 RepID=UPI0037A2B17B